MPRRKAKWKCDLCGFLADRPTSLGLHKRYKHGIAGTSEDSVRKQQLKLQKAEQTAAKPRGPYKKTKAKASAPNAEIVVVRKQTEVDSRPAGIAESTLAVAFGRFIEFQKTLAAEYDLPPRQFAREFTALISRSAIR